ncbi:MAG: response regulator [Steroidobacteraceae bacterium]|nr:response regulator [Steroidobacteraceae bacterium]
MLSVPPAAPLVVYVDDEPDLGLLVGLTLESGGRLRCRTFTSGESALAALGGLEPALVLLDVSMPGLDGPAIVERMRREPRLQAVPFAFVTARGASHDDASLRGSGAVAIFRKPFVPRELRAQVLALCGAPALPAPGSGPGACEEPAGALTAATASLLRGRREAFLERAAADTARIGALAARLAGGDPAAAAPLRDLAHRLGGVADLYVAPQVARACHELAALAAEVVDARASTASGEDRLPRPASAAVAADLVRRAARLAALLPIADPAQPP